MANNSKEKLIEKLQNAIDAENTLSNCCSHMFSLVHSGKIRSEFKKFSDIAKENINILRGCLKDLGVENLILEDKCKYCKIDIESFSLIGAINLACEIIDVCIKFYKELKELCQDRQNKNLFKELVKEKTNQKNFLKKESGLAAKGKEGVSVVDHYCLPEVASKLWK